MSNKVTLLSFLYTSGKSLLKDIHPPISTSIVELINQKLPDNKKISLENSCVDVEATLNDLDPDIRMILYLSEINLDSGEINPPTTSIQPISNKSKPYESIKENYIDIILASLVTVLTVMLTYSIFSSNADQSTFDNIKNTIKIFIDIIKKLIS